MDKSRREKRKEARLAKRQSRHSSWIEHQRGKKDQNKKNALTDSKQNSELAKMKIKEKKSDSLKKPDFLVKGKSKSKFQEFLELDMGTNVLAGEEDLGLEKKLAKKLKVKEGKLRGPDDGINFLLGGSSLESDDDIVGEDDINADSGKIEESELLTKKKHKKNKSSNASKESFNHEVYDTHSETLEKVDTMNADGGRKKHKKRKNLSDASTEQLDNDITTTEGGRHEKVDTINSDGGQKRRKMKSLPTTSEEHLEEEPTEGKISNAEELDTLPTKEPHTVEPAAASSMKYMPPQVRARLGIEFDELLEVRRRVKRLLNQLNESNVESITKEVATIYKSLTRSDGCQIVSQAFLEASTKNESFSAAFAAFVAGMACMVGIDFSAKLISSLAESFEDEYSKENAMFLKNFSKILCNMCIFGVCSSDLIYDLLSVLSNRLIELDVSAIDTILDNCGMKLRGDDPVAMKDFIFNIQKKVTEFRSLSDDSQEEKRSISRMDFMLEKICNIKNNKMRVKEVPAYHTRIRKWLQKLRVDDILLRGIKWSKLLDPEKKGQWWISGDGILNTNDFEDVAATINKEVVDAQKLMQLAAAQRMNTDIRRAIFCIIMSSEDYLDAFEKLLRLDLTGKQDREIMRVLVDCCLQEKVFNKYYTVLASKLCNYDKNNKFSLQYCLWDHFKELESMELNRAMNLARFAAEMLCNFSLSLSALKAVDLASPSKLTPKRVMHFRMLFELVFNYSDAEVWNIFTRIAGISELEMLRNSLIFFIKQYVVAANNQQALAAKFKIAKKALSNAAGVLM
ncbi:nucleolar MIF4G domain-containing protein 1-like [Zingiber officinale]|uniref:nucleolar MIF4G domain-containing protein 1-like n=1 Tax=Zingiber officinale TaxID=94328 RepID=UPI001C4CD7F0|nr:nucleolar MIF4G domain-containing protein 1-like [Zingiber officinale]XP_042377340.1 nucleolar MIF4G domain-containing protein 1-like [Zingiber officinale]XP_042377341.1 nucleolar MIF4G domain-containing protein 1-like [Zingiber officinale]